MQSYRRIDINQEKEIFKVLTDYIKNNEYKKAKNILERSPGILLRHENNLFHVAINSNNYDLVTLLCFVINRQFNVFDFTI